MSETGKIYQAMADINKGIEAIKKGQKNAQQGFMYRGIDDVMNELHNLFAEHEVIILTEMGEVSCIEKPSKTGGLLFYKNVPVKFTFVTTDGSFVTSTIVGEAMDSGDKAVNKCISVALKYALLTCFLIPTDDLKDPDAEVHAPIHIPEPAPKTSPLDSRPTLSNSQLMQAIERIGKGEVEVRDECLQRFRCTAEQKEKLNAAYIATT